MGRLHHLKETLPRNLHWNKNYPNLEHVVLDYNSPDGLENWIKSNFMDFIESGRLAYYKFPEPQHFMFSHARNMLLRLASGEIICNLDADNYTGKNFAVYINEQLRNHDFILGAKFLDNYIESVSNNVFTYGSFGRIAIHKNLMLDVNGYDEHFKHWGYEDNDLYYRLKEIGYKYSSIEEKYLYAIAHEHNERVENAHDNEIKDLLSEVGYDKYIRSNFFKESAIRSNNNIAKRNFAPNNGKFGCGIVYKNFSKEPIILK